MDDPAATTNLDPLPLILRSSKSLKCERGNSTVTLLPDHQPNVLQSGDTVTLTSFKAFFK